MSCNTSSSLTSFEYVSIDGYEHYIEYSIQNEDDPIVLFIHGGPGMPCENILNCFPTSIIDKVNFVSWHQKGSGQSYVKNGFDQELSFNGFVEDAKIVVEHLKKKFHKDRLILFGGSWGSSLGFELAKRIPESISKYIGVGQVVNSRKAQEYMLCFIEEMMQYSPNPDDLNFILSFNDKEYPLIEDWHRLYYLSRWYDYEYANMPDMTSSTLEREVAIIWSNASNSSKSILLHDFIDLDFEQTIGIEVPVVFLNGKMDRITPLFLVEQLYENISAPSKKLYRFDKSGHNIINDEPDKFRDLFLSELQLE